MKDFILSALPFVLMGLALAVFAAGQVRKKKSSDQEKQENHKRGGKNIPLGMALGMLAGVAFGTAGVLDLATYMSLGTLWGIVIASLLPDKDAPK